MSETDRAAAIATGGTPTPCPVCGHENPADATVCAACGNEELGVVSAGPDPLAAKVKLFRVLVVISTASYLLLFAEPYAALALYSQDAVEALKWQGYGAMPMPAILIWLKPALYVVAAVSLLRFSRPGRLVYTLLLAFSILLSPLSGVSVGFGIGALFAYAFSMADGAILLMMWTTPLKERFVRL